MSTPPRLRFHSFWSINGALDQARLRRQMDAMQAAGLDGVVFHPRYYPGAPPYLGRRYLAEVSAAILHAKAIGLGFWLYDENGWPSGTADGRLLRKHPRDQGQRLELSPAPAAGAVASCWVSPEGELTAPGRRGARSWQLVPRSIAGIDDLEPEVSRHFLALVHERYRRGLAPEAFAYVGAFFTDEPESGAAREPLPAHAAAPWSRRMLPRLRARFGADVAQKLPLLFFRGEGHAEFRVAFWEFVTDQFGEGFFDPYRAWCERRGKRLVGHLKGEESPLFQLPMGGSFQRLYRHLSFPGIDSLERFPANHFYPRQAASVAAQFGDGRCLAECFGGAGWGARPEDLERYLLWLARHGLTDFVLHLGQYRLDTPAIRDWPPSQPLHLNWRAAYPEVLRRVKRELAQNPAPAVDTLVVTPCRGIMAAYEPWEVRQTNLHNASTHPDTPAARLSDRLVARVDRLHAEGAGYHVTDERTLEESGRVGARGLRLGRCRYQKLILGEGVLFRGDGKRLLAEARAAGVRVADAVAGKTRGVIAVSARRASRRTMGGKISPAWRMLPAAENTLLLEPRATGARAFRADFASEIKPGATGELRLVFADDATALTFNGRAVALRREEEGVSGGVPWTRVRRRNTLRFRCAVAAERPYVWLRGDFHVASRTSFAPGPSGTVRTRGPFVLRPAAVAPTRDWAKSGRPFARAPLGAETEFVLRRPAAALRLIGAEADAARVWVDGRDLGWAWGPDWRLALTQPLTPGRHTLRLELTPSTYNTFGPHRYIGGDWPVVSPDQFVGRKNFADPAGAPECTLGDWWHFKPLRLPAALGRG